MSKLSANETAKYLQMKTVGYTTTLGLKALEIKEIISFGVESYVVYVDTTSKGEKSVHKVKLCSTEKGDYFCYGRLRIYLNTILRA